MVIHGRIRSAGLLCAALLSGCVSTPRFHPLGELQTAEKVVGFCSHVAEKSPSARSVRAVVEAHIRVSGSQVTSFRYGIMSKEPALLRIDVLPLEGAYAFGLLLVREDGAVLIDATNQEYTEEQDANELLRQFLGIEGLTRQAVLALVTGRMPSEGCQSAMVYNEGQSAVVVDAAAHIAYTIDVKSGEVSRLEIMDEANKRVSVRADVSRGSSSPREINLEVYSPVSATASMVVRKVILNPVVPDSLFDVPIPAGYRRTE